MRSRWSRGALMSGSSQEEETHGHTRPCEEAGAMPPQPMGRQALPVASGGRRKQRRTLPLPPRASGGAQPCRRRDFGPMASRTVREHVCCFMPLSLRPFVRAAPQTKALTSNHAPRIQTQNTGEDRREAGSKPCPNLLGDCGQAGPPL